MEGNYQIDLDTDRYKTEDMYAGGKKDLIKNNHPVIRQLREIPEVLFQTEEKNLAQDLIALKTLFLRENIDKYSISSKILVGIAYSVLQILQELADKGFTIGLGDLSDWWIDPTSNWSSLYLVHPEKFQLLHFEQDYEWYPEDEKLLGDLVLLEKESQELADCRLIYKILIGASRGSVKNPPKTNQQDYAELFYKKLPMELKDFFSKGKEMHRKELEQLLLKHLREKENGKEENDSRASQNQEEDSFKQSPRGRDLYCMYVILRTNLQQSIATGRLVYDLQDTIAMECQMGAYQLKQSFIYGDGNVHVRSMQEDPVEFRVQVKNKIKNYSAGEVLLIAAEEYGRILREEQLSSNTEKRCIIVFDGDLENTTMFQYAVKRLEELKEEGIRYYLTSDQKYDGEACQQLQNLLYRQEDYYVIKNSENI